MKINIKGQEYDVELTNELIIQDNVLADGVCDYENKKIRICVKEEFNSDSVIRHELIHAFLYESGLRDFAHNEILVDWMSTQIPNVEKSVDLIKN